MVARGRRAGRAAPGHERVDGAAEMLRVHVVKNREKVVVLALREERGEDGASGADAMTVVVDVVPDDLRRVAIAAHNVANERLLNGGRRVEEHQVQARAKDAAAANVRDHAVPVVGDGELHRAGERRAQAALEHLPSSFMDEDLRVTLGKAQGDLRRVHGVRYPKRRRGHARCDLRVQSTTPGTCHGVVSC